jgi:hypothetical protein
MARPLFATNGCVCRKEAPGYVLSAPGRVGSCSGAMRGASSTHADHYPAPPLHEALGRVS